MGDPCGIRGFGEGEKHKIKQIIKKYKKSAKSEKKNWLKMIWNALRSPRNAFKNQNSKTLEIGEIWKKMEIFIINRAER